MVHAATSSAGLVETDQGQSFSARHWTRPHALLIDLAAAFLCVLPLLLTAHIPLTDLPNHLARQYIIRDIASSPILQNYYVVHWKFMPNLALELFVLPTRHVMSPDLAVRLFCITTMLLLFSGTWLVNGVFSQGRSHAYRFTPFLCYGGPFQYGFLGYCFGIGLAMTLFGLYLHLRTRQAALRILFLIIAGFALILSHLVPYALFAIAVGICELTGNVAEIPLVRPGLTGAVRRISVPVACLLAVAVVFVLASPMTSRAGSYDFHYSDFREHLRSLTAITFFSSRKLEVGLLILAAAGLVVSLASKAVRFHATGLAIVITMTLIWLATPGVALSVNFVDYRLPWAIAFFVVAALTNGVNHRHWGKLLAGLFGTLVVMRIGLIVVLWLRWEPTLAAIDHALSQLPEGARLMVVEGRRPAGMVYRDPDMANAASYAVARRAAFYPGIFASISGQILDFQPDYRPYHDIDYFSDGNPSELSALRPVYQYLLVLRPELTSISPDIPVTCQTSGPQFELYRVVPPDQAKGPRSCER